MVDSKTIDYDLIIGIDFNISVGLGRGSSNNNKIDYITNTSLLNNIININNLDNSKNSQISMDCFTYDRIQISIDFTRKFGWNLNYLELVWIQNKDDEYYIPYINEFDPLNSIYTYIVYVMPFDSDAISENELPFAFENDTFGNYTFTSMIFDENNSYSFDYTVSTIILEVTFNTSQVYFANSTIIDFISLQLDIETAYTSQPTIAPSMSPTVVKESKSEFPFEDINPLKMPLPHLCFRWYYYILLCIPSAMVHCILFCCADYRYMLERDCAIAARHRHPRENPSFSTLIIRSIIPSIGWSQDIVPVEEEFIKECEEHFRDVMILELQPFFYQSANKSVGDNYNEIINTDSKENEENEEKVLTKSHLTQLGSVELSTAEAEPGRENRKLGKSMTQTNTKEKSKTGFAIEESIFDIILGYSHEQAEAERFGFASLYSDRIALVAKISNFVTPLSWMITIFIIVYIACICIIQLINMVLLFEIVYPEWHESINGNKDSWLAFEGFNTMLLILHPTCKVFQYVLAAFFFDHTGRQRYRSHGILGRNMYQPHFIMFMGNGYRRVANCRKRIDIDTHYGSCHCRVHRTIRMQKCVSYIAAVITIWMLFPLHGLPSLFVYYIPSFVCFVVVLLFFGVIFLICVYCAAISLEMILKIKDTYYYGPSGKCDCCFGLFGCRCLNCHCEYRTVLLLLLFLAIGSIGPLIYYGCLVNLYVDVVCWYKGHEWSDCLLYGFVGQYCENDQFDPFVYFQDKSDWKSWIIGIAMLI